MMDDGLMNEVEISSDLSIYLPGSSRISGLFGRPPIEIIVIIPSFFLECSGSDFHIKLVWLNTCKFQSCLDSDSDSWQDLIFLISVYLVRYILLNHRNPD